jgi:hypothetical protein
MLKNATTKNNVPLLLVMTNNAATRIQQARCNCWMTMLITFPAMPYVTLALLAMAICISFLGSDRSIASSL